MNRAEHEAIIRVAIKKGLEYGYTPDQIAKGAVDRVYAKIELDAEMADAEVLDLDRVKRPDLDERVHAQAPAIIPIDDPLPPPPPSAGSSIVIDDNAPIKASPLRLPGGNKTPSGPMRYWKQDHLRDYLYENTQESVQVMAHGRKDPITLVRNIEIMPGIDLVKLSYGIGGTNYPSPSQPNGPDGSALPAMAVDAPVCCNFSCFEKIQDIDGKMQAIMDQAAFMYAPKPEHINSTTPRRVGNLSYRLPSKDNEGDPHDEVRELPNPITGKVW